MPTEDEQKIGARPDSAGYGDKRQFKYGPLAWGLMVASISITPIINILFPDFLGLYLIILLAVIFGLRPLLEKTGLYRYFSHFLVIADDKIHRKFEEKRAREVWQKRRDDSQRKRRRKHPDLPKNW